MQKTYIEAVSVAMQVLEAIRKSNPELIADNMPKDWGMNALRDALQTPPKEAENAGAIAFTSISTLPSQHVIVEVIYDTGRTGFSWREGADEDLGSDAFDKNHGEVIGWRFLQPGQTADQETLDLHAAMLLRLEAVENSSNAPRVKG